MSDEFQDRPLKATLKAGPGYEAPWLTVAASDVYELNAQLDAITQDVLQKVSDLAALFRGAHNVSVGITDQPAAAPQQTQQAAPAQTQGLKTCSHGVRTKRTGTNSKGAWTGYFCPLEKGNPNQCDPIWE